MRHIRIPLTAPIGQVRLKHAAAPAAAAPSLPTAAPREEDEAALQRLTESLLELLTEHEARRRQSLQELQHVAVELAIVAASQIVAQAIDAGVFAVESLVAEAVATLGRSERIVVALHPLDLALLHERIAGRAPDWPVDAVSFRPDPALGRGNCRADAEEGLALISDVGARLSDMRRHWLEGIDESQVERRHDADSGRPLRRFPDRRETA
jgi:hypothetical protein